MVGHRMGGSVSSGRSVLLLGVLCAVASTPSLALAQDAAGPETEVAKSQEVVITEKARRHFRAGVNLLQDPDGARYEEAYRQFKAAYAESPSWKVLSNLGITAMKLERDGEAIDAFARYLKEGGDQTTEVERDQFQRDLETLRATVGTVTISAEPSAVQLVDERVTNRGGNVVNNYVIDESGKIELRLRPGLHRITARLSGYESETWEVEVPASGVVEHSFRLEKPQPKSGTGPTASPEDQQADTYRPVPLGVWVGAGVTGALALGALGTGIVAINANDEYDDANRKGEGDADDLRKQVKTMNLVTDVLIGSAAVAGVITAVFYVSRPAKARPTAVRVDPLVSPQFAGLSLSGSF